MAVSKRLRFEVMRRDNHACRYCGGVAPDVVLTIDHVVPVALGGTDTADNLVTACRDCNAGKSSVPADAAFVADVAQDAVRWSAAIKRATADALAVRERQFDVEKLVFQVLDDVAVPGYRGGGTLASYLPPDWFVSITQFIAAGLAADELRDVAAIAVSAYGVKPQNIWRYFCGIAWNKVHDRQEAARALLSAQEPSPPKAFAELHDLIPEHDWAVQQYVNLSATCDNPYWRAD